MCYLNYGTDFGELGSWKVHQKVSVILIEFAELIGNYNPINRKGEEEEVSDDSARIRIYLKTSFSVRNL
jgi:hypothetical protein